tara:strand:- start:1231 stop:2334 length:1104 start_codon:yes stop_codon:yes gene_type:complete
MIVKDEEKDIERCLKSVYKHIDYWVIIDTGSKDKTVKKVKSLMKNRFKVPGELHERPWVDFSHNRNEALEIAETKADYVMFMDADDIFQAEKNFNLDFLLNDNFSAYNSRFTLNGVEFERTLFVNSLRGWRYEGVLHEFIKLEGDDNFFNQIGVAPNCQVCANASPLKRASTEKEKYLNDAKVLEEALKEDPENCRYKFYLAQCYSDAKLYEKAIETYEERIAMGGWDQEVYVSMYRISCLRQLIEEDKDQFLKDLTRAWEYMPNRFEAAAAIMNILIEEGRNSMAFSYGEMTIKFQRALGPRGDLFSISDAENFVFPKNYAIAAEKCGFPQIAIQALKLLKETGGDNIIMAELDRKIKDLESKCSA